MTHDFAAFPELANSQLACYYWESPHKQILESFRAKVVKVIDGDTIRVKCGFRDFDFPVRLLGTNAPEMNEPKGKEAQSWLESRILNENVDVIVDPKQRVGKWGRILGKIICKGININDESIMAGIATTFENRKEGKIPNLNKELAIERWLA